MTMTSSASPSTSPSGIPAVVPGPRAPIAPTAVRPLSKRRPLLDRVSGVAVLLVVVDLVSAIVAALIAGPTWKWGLAVATSMLFARAAAHLYRRRLWLSYYHDLPRELASTAAAFGLLASLALLRTADHDMNTAISETVLLFLAISAPQRVLVFQLGRWARRRFDRCERAIVVGVGPLGIDLARSMQDHPEFGLRPVAFVDSAPPLPGVIPPVPVLDSKLHEAIVSQRAGAVVIAFSHATDAEVVDAAITAHSHGATILMLPRLWELYHDAPHIERLRGYPLVRLTSAPTARFSWWVKRGLDAFLAGLALLLLAPMIGAAALAVLLESGRPVLFRQERVGLDGRIFTLFKLRSMRPVDEREAQTRWSIAGDPRIGPVGRVLRRTSVDELPQLWNVLRGDMSLVGPRPERPGFVREFSEVHDRYWARHRVPSGLTGLAQVNGLRGDTSIADRSRYDNYYIANWSLWLDLKILLLTFREIFRGGQH
jgi:exopolysaccharide biosynthesis polyprenyl glycosylphosphotransferase